MAPPWPPSARRLPCQDLQGRPSVGEGPRPGRHWPLHRLSPWALGNAELWLIFCKKGKETEHFLLYML